MRVSRRPDSQAATELARQLGALMRELDLAEIEVSLGTLKVRLQRPGAAPAAYPVPMAPAPTPAAGPVVDVATSATLVTVEAPMVGTFYRAPPPTTQPTVPVDERAYVATTVAVGGGERAAALQLYAAGQFPGACERFSRAAADNPKSPVWRQDVARCFEAWGRDVLRQNRPEEALLLFRQGLKALPDDPALLKAAGIAAIHGGRPSEALEPLERATAHDVGVRLPLARLYDQRDQTDLALAHLTALLARESGHAAARRLLEKIERERRVEAAFSRETTEHFVVKHRAAGGEAVRPVVQALERAWERVGDQLDYHPTERVTIVLYEGVQFHDVTR